MDRLNWCTQSTVQGGVPDTEYQIPGTVQYTTMRDER